MGSKNRHRNLYRQGSIRGNYTYTAAFFEEEVIKNLRSVLFTFFLLSDKIEPKELAIDFYP